MIAQTSFNNYSYSVKVLKHDRCNIKDLSALLNVHVILHDIVHAYSVVHVPILV